MNWADLRELADDGLDAGNMRRLAHAHNLDLPHLPGIIPLGIGQWELYCPGCTLELGGTQKACQYGFWDGPKVLYDVPVLSTRLMAIQLELARPA